ncbi:MAG: restriction endonuclease subunit S [Poseidonibacter sp.]|uniref:restriction endonuclease subunit S n=1 Tax=Poseidonibacter sp. TaxID=2321188 RepID=UPI00359D0830
MKYKKYPSYKDSGVEWLGEIPSKWTYSKLKYYIDNLVAGGTPKTDNKEYWSESNEGLPWVSISDMTRSELVKETKKNVTYKGITDKNLKVLPKGTILYSIFASLGKVAITDVPLTTNQAILGLLPNKKIDKRFLYWLLIGLESYVQFTASSNTQDNLNSEKVSNFPLSIPLNEQQQIAKFLDSATQKIDTLITKQEKLIELLKEKRQSVISHAVTKGLNPDVKFKDSGVEWLGNVPEHWSVSKIGYYAFVTKLTGFEYTNLWRTSEDGEIIALRGFNIKERKLDLSKTEKITGALSKKLSRSKLSSGDIVFPCTGTIGNAAIIESDNKFHINQNIAKITFDSCINPSYAVYWMLGTFIKKTIDKNNMSGMQPVVLIGDIRNLPIIKIDYVEQQQIANYLDDKISKIDTLIGKSKKSIKLLKEKRTALISAAVTGKIDVRETL